MYLISCPYQIAQHLILCVIWKRAACKDKDFSRTTWYASENLNDLIKLCLISTK